MSTFEVQHRTLLSCLFGLVAQGPELYRALDTGLLDLGHGELAIDPVGDEFDRGTFLELG
ncbi:hypothetical protein D3C87_2198010 [compost metagenome]